MNVAAAGDDGAPRGIRPRIVGLGASAGGLEALEQFLSHVPAGCGLAFVVVQHLDPTHKAMLAELLQRVTAMTVREATDATRIEAGMVYVIPSNAELTVAGGLLQLAPPVPPRGLRLPIDVLFSSLARDQGEHAIGVVLSGMGSDGTLGLQAIRTQGGLTCAQEPLSAQFDSMPRSAIESGAAQIVAPAAELPRRILRVTAAAETAARPALAPEGAAPPMLQTILELVHARTQHDLGLYKPSTLQRRIERRMGIHGFDSMPRYTEFLRENPLELDLLFKEMLIGVTRFFRDAEVWEALESRVLPETLTRGTPDDRLRAWVVGCSTGEEAYSLAMLIREAIEARPAGSCLVPQIFATDLNADALAFARRGLYPARIATEVSPPRLARFFSLHSEGYQVASSIREMVLFAQHDVVIDPPFTRLDLLACRNLMIYFDASLQRRLLPLFHYSLRAEGALILGESETVGASQALFAPLSPKLRLYRRSSDATVAGSIDFPVHRTTSWRVSAKEQSVANRSGESGNLQSLADHFLLQAFSPPAVLVNEYGDVVYIHGSTGKFLEPAAGKANWNIHVMARPAIRTQLAVALRQAVKDGSAVELRSLRLEGEADRTLHITVQAITATAGLEGMAIIVFREASAPPRGRTKQRAGGSVDPAIGEELLRLQDEIKALREAMRAADEERQAATEELQSTNEELQSANEELTTSKEEAQSMNEELQTINAELRSKLDALALAQSDMQNLLNSTDIATLFLDKDLNVRRFTDPIKRIIHLRDGDIGRPLSDLASTLNYPELHQDAKEVVRTLAFSEKEISSTDDHWFTVRIMPYRTIANVIQGAVITFVDITAAKALESRLRHG